MDLLNSPASAARAARAVQHPKALIHQGEIAMLHALHLKLQFVISSKSVQQCSTSDFCLNPCEKQCCTNACSTVQHVQHFTKDDRAPP